MLHPHLGQGSMLRIALLPAPNVVNLERYMQLGLKWLENIEKSIDKKAKIK